MAIRRVLWELIEDPLELQPLVRHWRKQDPTVAQWIREGVHTDIVHAHHMERALISYLQGIGTPASTIVGIIPEQIFAYITNMNPSNRKIAIAQIRLFHEREGFKLTYNFSDQARILHNSLKTTADSLATKLRDSGGEAHDLVKAFRRMANDYDELAREFAQPAGN